jgi:hypothetical protein
MTITENQLDEWVRGNSRDAQGAIVEIIWRLVAASSPRPKERRFPLGDSIGQHGPDGLLDVDLGFEPFVPDGRSFWEIGTGLDAGSKATSDYGDLIAAIPEGVRLDSVFVFVTPLSGRRDWEHTWKEDAQERWLARRREKAEWKDVRVIDGTRLVDWVHQFPSVALWLGQRTLALPITQIETPEQRWSLIKSIGEPPPLTPQVFLANRGEACAKIKDIFDGTAIQLKLNTHFPDQVVDFVSAYLADLDQERRADAMGRCLVISGADAWNAITGQREKHVLVADSALDLTGDAGMKLIQKARRAGHAVIFGGAAGGIPDPTCVPLASPQTHQLKDALEKAGYGEERARTLTQKSGGNLGSLLRCLQNLSLMPEWAEGSAAADLVIAAVLGSWTDESAADRAVAERASGKAYGEWIGKVREVALSPGTPLRIRDGNWKFIARYEGWYALGPNLFDEHLDRIRASAVHVLEEKDPQFDLPPQERYAASIHGKVLAHSHSLRKGLAECLALLGSHPKALSSCTPGKAEATAVLSVRAVLSGADWVRWASLNDLLPLLAEAAPGEFLDRVEKALDTEPCPFDEVLAQEGDGFMSGGNYITGLLWSLETLAWDANQLSRVVICLGDLAAHDHGGRWANRPANSLVTILLPWLPQTCASVAKRGAAVAMLVKEYPEVAWKLLLGLLPQSSSASSGSRKPEWRETIPDDWQSGVTVREYNEQIALYSEMAITVAKGSLEKLVALIGHLDSLPSSAHQQLLDHLSSDALISAPPADRLGLWSALIDLTTRHRKFHDAGWAMAPAQVDKLAAIAAALAPTPTLQYQRLFSERDFDLYEEKGNFADQRDELELRRRKAVEDVAAGGLQAVLTFAAEVQSPWRVGVAFGSIAGDDVDSQILPSLLAPEPKSHAKFAGGFVRSRFFDRGWQWVDGFDSAKWTPAQISEFLSLLPFVTETWERSARLLGSEQNLYWTKTSANPYDADLGLELAIEQLIKYERPYAALRCLHRMQHAKRPLNAELATRALLAAMTSPEGHRAMEAHDLLEIIKALQNDLKADPDDIARVEWAYLPLLDRHNDASPRLLGRRLATEPSFFCEVVRVVFRSTKEERRDEELTERQKSIATNAYRLLHQWQTPPGCQDDGTYDGTALGPWLAAVKAECLETGHLEIALTMVGHSMIHVPPDPDGLWIHRSAADALNGKDAGDMRDGFRTELANSRGAHFVDPSGAPERELAAKYLAQAEAAEAAGYQRLATTIRELADSYLRQAEHLPFRERFDE